MTTLSRIRRTLAPRSTLPSVTLAARDLADLGDVEHLLDRRVAEEDLAHRRRQQARHGRFHVVHEIVDDVVVADLDALRVGGLLGLRVGADVEADHDGLRGAGQRDVGFGDAADAGVHDARLDLVGAELLAARPTMASTEPCTSPLMSSGNSLRPALLQLLHHLLERARRAGRAERLAALADAVVGDLAGAAFVLDDGELVAGLRSRVEAQDLDRNRRPGLADVSRP